MSKILFSKLKHQKEVTLTGYHWSSEKIDLKQIKEQPIGFCDDRDTWAHLGKDRLYEMIIHLNRPFVALDSKRAINDRILGKIQADGFDGVIYCPSTDISSLKQGILFNPKNQILFIQKVDLTSSLDKKHSFKI